MSGDSPVFTVLPASALAVLASRTEANALARDIAKAHPGEEWVVLELAGRYQRIEHSAGGDTPAVEAQGPVWFGIDWGRPGLVIPHGPPPRWDGDDFGVIAVDAAPAPDLAVSPAATAADLAQDGQIPQRCAPHAHVWASSDYRNAFRCEDCGERIKRGALPNRYAPPSVDNLPARLLPLPEHGGCASPPRGWWCSRPPGHDGPCAARPAPGGTDTTEVVL
jgi:hypothetical protein